MTILLAVSGGADSVALLRAIVRLKTAGEGRVVAAHLNHQLRPDEADADEAFVVDLCRRLGVACEVGRVATRPGRRRGPRSGGPAGHGIGSSKRRPTACGARYVVTAHTADDQAETILHRILRGTGVGGLGGMSRTRPLGLATLLRPLLTFRRAELEAYLHDLGQPYCDDSSNRDVRFTRNRIRHELLPWLSRAV